MEWMAGKLQGLRIFPDAEGMMNLDVGQIGGELLVVSQFTLYGDVSRGRRPSFVGAASPDMARRLYQEFVDICRAGIVPVATGEFGARMEVALVNDGPVTLVLER
jgi:D-tyrosyl-tRNA(Tyr) deacylase